MNIELLNKVNAQIDICYKKYGDYASFAEAMSIFREEFEELWFECKQKDLNLKRVEEEIIDCITVLIKMHTDVVEKKVDTIRRKDVK